MEANDIKKVLWVSAWVPYDKVPHAGGQIHNYYLKKLHEHEDIDIQLVTFSIPSDEGKIDLDKYGIRSSIIKYGSGIKHLFWGCLNQETKFNPYNRYGGGTNNLISILGMKELKRLYSSGYTPDIIILHWTQIVLLTSKIQKLWPHVPIISIEEDVFFLSHQRKMESNSGIKKWFWKKRYQRLKDLELQALKKSSLVILNNEKDKNLLLENNVNTQLWVWTPYFKNMLNIQRTYTDSKDIIFFGAMNREENWRSAIWFIENVMPKLPQECRFLVLGNKPNEQLKKHDDGNRIKIMGFVEDIKPYFSNALCLVSPLVMGAGVKIKILEALSAGIPVLTNQIGIEGIPGTDCMHYFHCETPDDYVDKINLLLEYSQIGMEIGNNAKHLISGKYNFKNDAETFYKKLMRG